MSPDHFSRHVDPLVACVKKAYRSTKRYQLDQLLKEESKWKRRQTIADNHLAYVREQISKLAKELADEQIKNQKPAA